MTRVSASISTEKFSFAFVPNGMISNGNKIMTNNFGNTLKKQTSKISLKEYTC